MKGFIACLLVIIAALLAVIAGELVGRNLQDASLGGERGTDPEGKVDAIVRMPDDGRKELPIRWVLRGDPVPDSVISVPSPNDPTVGGEEKKPLPTLNIVRKEKNPLCDRVGPKTEMKGADLSGCDLSGKDLQVADFSNANLSDANLAGADLRDVDLRGANLSGANLRGAKLFRTNLQGTDVTNADFRDATDVNLQGAKGTPAHLPAELEASESELAESASEGNEEAEVYYNRGRAYYRKGEYDKAIADLTEAILLKKDLAEAYALRSIIYVEKGWFGAAKLDTNKVFSLQPPRAAYETRLANRLSRRSARAHQGWDWDTSALLTANEAGNVIGQFILLGYCSSSDKERIGREMVRWVDTVHNKVAIRHVREALNKYSKRYLVNDEFYPECEKELRRRFRK